MSPYAVPASWISRECQKIPTRKDETSYIALQTCVTLYWFHRNLFGITHGLICVQYEVANAIYSESLQDTYVIVCISEICGTKIEKNIQREQVR